MDRYLHHPQFQFRTTSDVVNTEKLDSIRSLERKGNDERVGEEEHMAAKHSFSTDEDVMEEAYRVIVS